MSSSIPKVNRQDIRRIMFEHFNDVDLRFTNDEILEFLNQTPRYQSMNLDVLDFEDVLLEMEEAGILRPIAQNFNTRYYKLREPFEISKCAGCGASSYHSLVEEGPKCPECKSDKLTPL